MLFWKPSGEMLSINWGERPVRRSLVLHESTTEIHKPTFLKRTIEIQYIPRNMHTVFALLCFVVVKHCLIFPYPSGLLHWHCGNLTIAPVPAKQPWWIWIDTSCEFIMNDCITTTKQSTTKPCAYFLGYTVTQQKDQGAVSIRKTVLPGMAIPMLKIRRPNGRLIFNMEITIRR